MPEAILLCNGRPVGAVYELATMPDGTLRGAVFFKDISMYRRWINPRDPATGLPLQFDLKTPAGMYRDCFAPRVLERKLIDARQRGAVEVGGKPTWVYSFRYHEKD